MSAVTAFRVLAFAGAVLVVLADQATKAIVRHSLAYAELVPVTPFFNLTHHYSRGAAFGMFAASGANALLLTLGILAMVVPSILLRRAGQDRWSATALAAILGGAAGNVIDRLRLGAVVDWLDFHAGGWHWPAFNLADAALTLGVALVLLADLPEEESLAALDETVQDPSKRAVCPSSSPARGTAGMRESRMPWRATSSRS